MKGPTLPSERGREAVCPRQGALFFSLGSKLRTHLGLCLVAVFLTTAASASGAGKHSGLDTFSKQTLLAKKPAKPPLKKVFVYLLRAKSLKKNVRVSMTTQLCIQLAKNRSIEVMCETDVVAMIEMRATMSGLGGNSDLLPQLEERAEEVDFLLIPVAKPVDGGHELVFKLYEKSRQSRGLAFLKGPQVARLSKKGSGNVQSATTKLKYLPQQLQVALYPVSPPSAVRKKK